MAKVSERVYQMKRGFMELHNEGYSIPEIAIMYNLSWSAVYHHLQEIADENGVSREDLLMRVHTSRGPSNWREEERRMKLDIQELRNGFSDADAAIVKICDKIDKLLEECEHDEV